MRGGYLPPGLLQLLLCCALLPTGLAQADPVQRQANLRCLSVDDNLSSSMVYDLAMDPDGYLWAATGNGFNRYDGYSFETFYHDPNVVDSISGSKLQSTLLDSRGRLWVGGNQLNRFDQHLHKFIRFDVSSGEFIKTIHEGDQGDLWIGGKGFGLRRVDAGSGRLKATYVHEADNGNSLPSNNVQDITSDGRGGLWLATQRGIAHFDPQSGAVSRYYPSRMFAVFRDDIVRSVFLDNRSRLWVATPYGVMLRGAGGDWKYFQYDETVSDSLPVNNTWSIFQDSDGGIWIGTDKHGLVLYNEQTGGFSHYAAGYDQRSIPPGAILGMQEDMNGAMWLTVFNYGICRLGLNDRKFNLYQRNKQDPEKGLGFNNVLDLHEDHNRQIWIATDGGGLDRFDPQTRKFRHYREIPGDANSLSSNSVLAIAEDASGILWLGTWGGGLNRFDPVTGQFRHYRSQPGRTPEGEGLLSDNIFHIWIDPAGQLWLSTWNRGLQRFDPETGIFTSYTPGAEHVPFVIQNRHINFIHQDRQGNLWIGGGDGLERVSAETQKVTTIQLNRQNDIGGIYEDADGIFWFATADGLVRYDDNSGKSVNFGKSDGFADNFITSIEADSSGELWLGTRRGLTRFNPKTGRIENFGVDYGLQGWEFNRFSHLRASDGTLYFGGTNGLNQFHPGSLPVNNHIPPVYINGLELFHRDVPIGPDSFITQNIRYLDELSLPYSQNDITLRFTALDYTAPAYNRFRFRLKGFDGSWTEVASSHREARYTNLQPGEYVFQVLASNNDGLWNHLGDSLKLNIIPPWWMTWQARLAGTLLLAFGIYLLFYARMRRNHRKQLVLQQLVEEKTVALETARQDLELANLQLQDKVMARTSELEKEIEVRRDAETQLKRMAYYDALTGLPNRAWLMRRLEQLLELQRKEQRFFSLLFMDGDQFKMINDSLGHLLGDDLLVKVSRRLQNLFPEHVYLTRQSGDEFIVLIEEPSGASSPVEVAEAILRSLRDPFFLAQKRIFFNVSIGIVATSAGYQCLEDILQDADIAMYRAKQRGKACYQLFDQTLKDRAQLEINLLSDLRNAIDTSQFHLVYQPIVSLADGSLQGFEALLRWNQPGRGPVSPDLFIRLAERNGLIDEIGKWVLSESCRQMQQWLRAFGEQPGMRISINLSARQLLQPDLPDMIQGLLDQYGISTGRLRFEITETALMENPELTSEILNRINRKGIELAIDDFGTGYSSLSYIHRFPVRYLKIDQNFVAKIEHDEEARIIVRAIISMAQSLKQLTVAEGIETEKQRQLLRSWSCDLGQGFLIDRPLDASSAGKWLSCQAGEMERARPAG